MADNKRYILRKSDIEAYEEWLTKRNKYFRRNGTATWDIWLGANPCPLPSPVEVPSDEYIESHFNYTGQSNAAKWLRDLIFPQPNPSNK